LRGRVSVALDPQNFQRVKLLRVHFVESYLDACREGKIEIICSRQGRKPYDGAVQLVERTIIAALPPQEIACLVPHRNRVRATGY
jgi:hypothetical protein